MGYLLKQIKKQILTIVTILFILVYIFGCGDVTNYKAENKAIISAAVVKDSNKGADQFNKVPIYGKKQKAEIKKYISSLPDKITVKEAKKRGIVIASYNNKNQFKKEWMDFYKYVRTGEKQYSPKYKALTCSAELHNKCAITILYYTVEGDACYTYLSFVNGRYYVLNDSSRDNFKASSWDGYSNLMTYKSLRKYKKRTSAKSTQFYLFKKQDVTRKKVKKIIENPDYNYGDNYYSVFEISK